MSERYETMAEVFQELRRRKFNIEESAVRRGMAAFGLHTPIDNNDLLDLISEMQLKRQDRYLREIGRKLASDRWRTSLIAARCKIGLPSEGIRKEEARDLHEALLETIAGAHKTVTIGTMTKLVLVMWTDLIREGRLLCRTLKMDPSAADKIYASFAAGSADFLMGVRKLLDPEGVLKIGGREMPYQPTPFDRLIGHLLWGLALSPIDIAERPSVSYRWERLPDGSGRFVEERFTPDQNTAAEDRELRKKLVQIKETMRHNALLQVELGGDLRDKTWQEEWRIWMKVFPDFSYPSPDALRKAVTRAMKKHSEKHRLEPSS